MASESGSSKPVWEQAVDYVARKSVGSVLDPALSVTVHFHPDQPVNGQQLLIHLASSDTRYRSQFETGTSNGGLTAHRGGDRWHWEHRMFNRLYDYAPNAMRPKYGSLNYRQHAVGGSTRFGSSHFRLSPTEHHRVTFCYPDSSTNPQHFGTASRMALIPLALQDTLDVIDDHIEAHVHGPLRIDQHIAAVVLDPSYKETAVEEAASTLPCPVEWHRGFRLHIDQLAACPDFRGPEIVAAGLAIAEDGWLTPRIIGTAVWQERYDPQTLKRIWHYVARALATPGIANPK